MSMRVLVVGSNGFIGSNLVRRLRGDGNETIAMVRPGGNLYRLQAQGIQDHVECDIMDLSSISKVLREEHPDMVVHLATRYVVQHRPEEVAEITMTNVGGTINLLEAVRAQGDIGLINTSSCFVYSPKVSPLLESDPLDPFNLYALTKLQAEEACRFYSSHYGLGIVNLRLFPPYGPGDNARKMIPSFIRSIQAGAPPSMTRGEQRWDYIFIDDVINAYVKVLEGFEELSRKGFESYNIGTGDTTSVRSIGEMILELMGSKIEPLWGALPERSRELTYLCSNIDKVKKAIGWAPRTTLREGLISTIDDLKREAGG
jgi:nucleoside-diphosphate-sugar epimerase